MLSGAVLQRVCLGNLAEIDPEKYGPALEQFVQEQYEDSMGPQPEGHLNVPLLILLDCFDTDTPTDVPSEPLQEAYFAQLGFLRQNFLQQKGRTYLAANEDGRVN